MSPSAGASRRSGPTLLELAAERAALGIERARLYDAAQAAESRYRGLFEGTADAVLVIDAAGHFLDANPPVYSLLGYSRVELLSLSIGDIVTPGQDWAETIFARSRREERWQAELELRRKDGTTVPVEVWTRIVLLPDGAAYIAALRDISERRALERLREEFVAMVTHELRSPLAAIDAYSQAGLRFGVPPEKALEVIRAQARQLDRMIRDLVDASRLAVGRMEIRCARMDLIELARQCADRAQTLSETHRVSLEAPAGPVVGHWDGGRLAQVLANLLTNAIKYSPDGGDVVICVEPGDDQVWVSVSDQGIGIAAEALPHVFERFRRAEAVRSGEIDGLGLGLYICRSLVEAHGGRIEVASRVGRGTAFTVSLPYSLPAVPARHADPATQSPDDPGAEQAATGGTILLVEDDPAIVAPLQIALELGGHRVLTAADGAEALAFARTERPDVVVLDLSVPGLDPAEFARVLQSQSRPGPRIVIASGDPRAAEVAARLEADEAFLKPFDLPTFLATMKRLAAP